MKQLLTTWLSLILLTTLNETQAQTVFQNKEDKLSASEAIVDLRDGILLIRFASNRNKTEALHKAMANAESQADSARLERELERTNESATQLQKSVIEALGSEFDFCEYAFFFDKDSKSVLSGKGPVFREDLETEVTIAPDRARYVMYVGRTPESSINGFVIVDRSLEPIPRPFPGVISRSGFAGLFGTDQGHIRRLNKKLKKYYVKVAEAP